MPHILSLLSVMICADFVLVPCSVVFEWMTADSGNCKIGIFLIFLRPKKFTKSEVSSKGTFQIIFHIKSRL